MKKHSPYSRNLFATILCIIFFLALITLFIHDGYPKRIATKLGIIETPKAFKYQYNDRTIDGWDRCLDQLGIDADIVFIGDSITHQSNFAEAFPDKVICNFGVGSDTITGINSRIGMLKTVSPEKIFLLCGINSINNNNINQCVSEYEKLVNDILSESNAELYLISVLPVSKEKSNALECSSDSIVSFNESVKQIALSHKLQYIDLYSEYEENGYIRPIYTTDGIHLTQEAYNIWESIIQKFL